MNYYVIDVFTDKPFKGNPAGVCLLDRWPDDRALQNVAAENNLPETAFVIPHKGFYWLRWFTPTTEVDLCGHATLATACVLFELYEEKHPEVTFKTLSGDLKASRGGDLLYLDLPARIAEKVEPYPIFGRAFGCEIESVYKAADFMVLLKDEDAVKNLKPDMLLLSRVSEETGSDKCGIIVTAAGTGCDFVSRFFAPDFGIDEDSVTGRAHCTLIPYWSEVLGKSVMRAKQLSKRGGELHCENLGKRVKIGGKAVVYLSGNILYI